MIVKQDMSNVQWALDYLPGTMLIGAFITFGVMLWLIFFSDFEAGEVHVIRTLAVLTIALVAGTAVFAVLGLND